MHRGATLRSRPLSDWSPGGQLLIVPYSPDERIAVSPLRWCYPGYGGKIDGTGEAVAQNIKERADMCSVICGVPAEYLLAARRGERAPRQKGWRYNVAGAVAATAQNGGGTDAAVVTDRSARDSGADLYRAVIADGAVLDDAANL